MNNDLILNVTITIIAGVFSIWSASSALKANRLLEETKHKFALQTYSREVTREKVEFMIDALTSEIRDLIRNVNEGKEHELSILPDAEYPKLLVSYGTSKAMRYYNELLKLFHEQSTIVGLASPLVCLAGMIQELKVSHTGIEVSIEDILKVYIPDYHLVEEEVKRCIDNFTREIIS